MHATTLPSGLWDLTISRISSRGLAIRPGRLGFAHSARHNAQPAFAQTSVSPMPFPVSSTEKRGTGGLVGRRRRNVGALTPRTGRPAAGPLAELEQRIIALKEAADSEVRAAETPLYSEEALVAMYEDLLAHPEEAAASVPELQAPREPDYVVVRRLEKQLIVPDTSSVPSRHSPLLEKLKGDTSPTFEPPKVDAKLELHRRVLQLAHAKLQFLGILSSSTSVPIPLFTIEEYKALTRLCIQEDDIDAAEAVLELMKRSGLVVPEESLTLVLRQYSDIGNATGAEYCLANFLSGPPTEPQRHLHVQAHLRATPRGQIPESALTVLHSYETQSHPAPMRTYTSVIAALYSTNLSLARAQAWDLFSHMRYVAHPTPDVVLYTQMIRACASPVGVSHSSEPERALDLWTEMTVEQKLTPTVGSFNAVILACARSGRKLYVSEAFRIAKQMLDSHRDASGRSAYLPDRGTISALLEGAKRIGDLSRTRWILADMVRSDTTNPEEAVNEEIMMHVFQTYAAYVPPFTRYLARLKGVEAAAASSSSSDVPASTELTSDSTSKAESDLTARFTHIPPQTSAEVIEEVDALFQRLMEDTEKQQTESETMGKFAFVKWTPRLVNSYLSVHFQHSTLEAAAPLFWSTFEAVGVRPDARCYVEAIERCGRGKKGRDREVGLEFAEKLWEQYHDLENGRRAAGTPLDARLVERAHGGFIRALAFNNHLARAMDQLKLFANRYPSNLLREPSPLSSFRSTRTVLVGPRPLVRLTTPSEVPDDDVPPFLLFDDLELLHHRLVAKLPPLRREIGYLKYVCKSYEWALRGRRDAAFQAEVPRPVKAVAAG
ncbi:hypothetical protein C8F01DRAFT_1162743 [Mycena amicta]|nr:hypothetical protein C8F01DRAFT_1162743 [Mycena amicta]